MTLAPGTKLGPYEILAPIGAGGMGEVWKAKDIRLGRIVAIKMVKEQHSERFKQEARSIAALNHPYICQLYDIGPDYLVLEYVEGEPLSSPLSEKEAVRMAIQIATALEAAHKKGIIHRDLKPANIMVTDEGSVKLLDFGLAKLYEQGASESTLSLPGYPATQAGAILGTVAYMSPEQAQGQPVDARSDIFSFGLVLYEVLSGRRAFSGDSNFALMTAIVKEDPAPLQASPSLEKIVRRCLAKIPSHRFQTMSELKMALGELLAGSAARGSAEPQSSIAVLAFADMSAGKDNEWFCDGIAEEILNALAPLKGLRVAARTSAFSFKGKSDDLRTIGEKLNVATVLEGSVRRAGDRVRITVQLSDVANGFQLWSERYDRDLQDIFDVQDEIAKAIAERLRVSLVGSKDNRLVEQATKNLEAYQLYLRGRALLDRRGAGVPTALDLFRKAVELDAGYSLAWAGIADAFTVLAYAGSVRGSESKSQAIAAARRSIELDPASAVGHTALACAILLYENNRAIAKQEFERAVELSPHYAQGRSWYALFYHQWVRGDFEKGIMEARRALESDPLSAYVTMILALCLYTAGRVDEAIEAARGAVQLDPESFVARWALGISLGQARRFEEAISTLQAAAGMSSRHSLALIGLARVLGQWGKPSEASALHRELLERASRAYVPLAHLALTAEAAGQHEEALAFVRRAWDEREPPFLLYARHFPDYRTLRSDPRFTAILSEMNEP